jgi:hypothetical protein
MAAAVATVNAMLRQTRAGRLTVSKTERGLVSEYAISVRR